MFETLKINVKPQQCPVKYKASSVSCNRKATTSNIDNDKIKTYILKTLAINVKP